MFAFKIESTRNKIIVIFLSAVLAFLTSAMAKPTLPFSLPEAFRSLRSPKITDETSTSSSSFPSFAQYVERRQAQSMKSYSGQRINKNSLIMVYYHDQTVAVVELGPQKLLIGCELIEIYNDEEGKSLLKKLSALNRPYKIEFKDMIKLMTQCQRIDIQNANLNIDKRQAHEETERKQETFLSGSPFSLFSGIIPGTKWCGTGDIAETYNDLGEDKKVDRCCRTHDLCPIKVRAYQKKYNLDNNSLYTKSHCVCDDMLFNCLKKSNSTSGQLMGSVYFNIVQVPCVAENDKGETIFRNAREGF